MEFLDIPFFDDDFFKMVFRFSLNIIFLTIIIRYLYYNSTKKQEYLFTYYLIGTIVFFICFALKKYELDIGMALGLFAIFGIIRYRTDAIELKDMTYLFVVIGVSVINSLANKKMSYAEILAGNVLVIGIIVFLERFWLVKQEKRKEIVYDRIENIAKQNQHLLKLDLEKRMGMEIQRIKIQSVDFMKDTAVIIIFYYCDE